MKIINKSIKFYLFVDIGYHLSIIKENISYSASAKRGSKRNPYLKENDLISVKNSILGKTTGVIKEFTAPFVGIYSTKEIIEGFSD